MADLVKMALRARVLEHLGVVGAGEAGSTQDQVLVDEAIDATHARLRKFGLVPFPTSAIPSWAQIPFRDAVAGDVAQIYGMSGQRLMEFKIAAQQAERELARQVSGRKPPVRVKPGWV